MLVAIFIATFIMFLDSYTVVRSGWYLEGIEALKRARRIDISGGKLFWVKARSFLAARIGLTFGSAGLTAIMLSLLIFGSDINARFQSIDVDADRPLIAAATI